LQGLSAHIKTRNSIPRGRYQFGSENAMQLAQIAEQKLSIATQLRFSVKYVVVKMGFLAARVALKCFTIVTYMISTTSSLLI